MRPTATPVLLLVAVCAVTATYAAPPLRDAFLVRAKSYLAQTAQDPSQSGAFADLARAATGLGGPLNGSDLESAAQKMNERVDCSDFATAAMTHLLISYGDSPQLSAPLARTVESALVQWQYWIDQANGFQGNMMFWTENHQFNFHTAEYLAGSYFARRNGSAFVFPGTNMTASAHLAHGRAQVDLWMSRRFLWGFSEWKSETYMQFDITALATLATIAPDSLIRTRAQMVLDLILFDVSIHAHKGMIASSRGRSYGHNKFNIASQAVSTTVQMLSGMEGHSSLGSNAAVSLAIAAVTGAYTVPEAILRVAQERPDALENRERIGVGPSEGAEVLGAGNLTLSTAEDGIAWFGFQGYAHPLTVELGITMGQQWSLFDSNETIFRYYQLAIPLRDLGLLKPLAQALKPLSTSLIAPSSSYIYRTPDVTLASALDFKKGVVGFQQHAWQATLNGTVVVFTTAPGPNVDVQVERRRTAAVVERVVRETLEGQKGDVGREVHVDEVVACAVAFVEGMDEWRKASSVREGRALGDANTDDYADGTWTGSASMPRVGQTQDVAIVMYQPPWLGEPRLLFPHKTHAYFPLDLFDETRDALAESHWIFGRQARGYVGLFVSASNVSFNANASDFFYRRELIATTHNIGEHIVYVAVIGREATHGSFANFTSTLLAADVHMPSLLDKRQVRITWKGSGRSISFGWDDPLTVVDRTGMPARTVPLVVHNRFENKYVQSPFPARNLTIAAGDAGSVFMDYGAGTRVLHE